MFRRKQDVDKHVLSILKRKKDEKEKLAQGFQIARLYADIKEYTSAKRYLAGFLQVRENAPQAHQLMGEIHESLGEKELAIESYKRALDLGGFGSSNRQLVLKICELYHEIGTDVQRMKYWLEKCELLFPRSDVIFKLKAKISSLSANGHDDNADMENVMLTEMVNRPTDVSLRIQLLELYLDKNRFEEAYDVAISTELTTAFVDDFKWYSCLATVFQLYAEQAKVVSSDVVFLQLYLHVLRNQTYLSFSKEEVHTSVQFLKSFDIQIGVAEALGKQEEWWQGFLKEMKGQLYYMAGLMLIKRALKGSLPWKEVNQLSGACFLASQKVNPMDGQAPWVVRPQQGYTKFYNWWHLESFDRMSQVGHMIQHLSQTAVVEWSKSIQNQTMTATGHKRLFETLYGNSAAAADCDKMFLYKSTDMVSQLQEPMSSRQLIDIDRVAHQVHAGKLSHLVWLCLQRYSSDMKSQPNYLFNVMENIQFSVKNLHSGSGESLCQLDVLSFLLASVSCASSAVSKSNFFSGDSEGRPKLLPVCLNKSLCSAEQEEWWSAAFQFCSNSVKDDFSRLRRVLMRGIEVIRLIGSHGLSVPLMCHLARSLDAKTKSLKEAEYGWRCTASELGALQKRAAFYWTHALAQLEKLRRNEAPPLVKNRLFKEPGDFDLTSDLVDDLHSEASYALSIDAMQSGRLEDALEGFKNHGSPTASFNSSVIYKMFAQQELDAGKEDTYKSLLRKARELLYETQDRLEGKKNPDLNLQVLRELDDLEVEIQKLEWDDAKDNTNSFYTPTKSSQENLNGTAKFFTPRMVHSTPRPAVSSSSNHINVDRHLENGSPDSSIERGSSAPTQSTSFNAARPRISPERLDSQIKSLNHNQTSMFKMVLDRNEELILTNGKMMEELRDNNQQLKRVLSDNVAVMDELKSGWKTTMDEMKALIGENRDTLQQLKLEMAGMKANMMSAPPPMNPGPPLFMGPHMAPPPPPRGPFPPYTPQPQVVPPPFGSYLLNSPVAPQPRPPYQTSGLPGSKASNVGKYRMMPREDEEEDEDRDSVDDITAMYPEVYESDPNFSKYYTPPEVQVLPEWPMGPRPGMEVPTPPIPMVIPPRMSMPQPGFFASALRGQALQYAQSNLASQSKQGMLGPGFFSTPSTSAQQVPVMPGMVAPVDPPKGSPFMGHKAASMFPSATNSTGLPATSPAVEHQASSNVPEGGSPALDFNILFHTKATLLAKQSKGTIMILTDSSSTSINILMVSDVQDVLFYHSAFRLQVEASFITGDVSWTATKVNSMERETVTVTVDPEPMAKAFKEALMNASIRVSGDNQASSIPPASTAAPKPFSFANSSPAMSTAAATPASQVGSQTLATTAPTSGATSQPGKTMVGSFTFSSDPIISPAKEALERELTTAHKASTSPTKPDAPKPFAGFSLTAPSSSDSQPAPKFSFGSGAIGSSADASTTDKSIVKDQKSPAAAAKSPGDLAKTPVGTAKVPPGGAAKGFGSAVKSPGEDERVEEYEPNVDFKPVISLPELVEKKTGEEHETGIFMERCRLFRFDNATSQWKERGIGELKILRSNDQVRFRIVMRRDQILKLCANHNITSSMKLTPMVSSDRAYCYSANDFAEEEIKVEQLAVKFKTVDKASNFTSVFNDCIKQLTEHEEKTGSEAPASSGTPNKPSSEAEVSSTTPALGSKTSSPGFKPQATEDQNKAASPGFKPQATGDQNKAASSAPKALGSGFTFGAALSTPSSVSATSSPSTATQSPAVAPATTSAAVTKPVSLSEAFKPKEGSWECDGCMLQNSADILKCKACETLKPGVKPEDVPQTQTGSSFFSNWASSGPEGSGFSFGGTPASTVAPGQSGGFTFGAPAASTSNNPPASGFSFGSAPVSTAASSVSAGSTPATGFRFGSASTPSTTLAASSTPTGFRFGSSSVTSTTTSTAANGSTPASGFWFGTAPANTATTITASSNTQPASEFNFGSAPVATTTTTAATTSGLPATSFSFGPAAPVTSTNGMAPATSTTSFGAFAFNTSSKAEADSTSSQPGKSEGFTLPPTFQTAGATPSKPKGSDSMLASLLSEDTKDSGDESKPPGGFSFSMTPSKLGESKFGGPKPTFADPAASTGSTFQFSLSKTPPASKAPPATNPKTQVPASPEVNEQGLYVTKEGDDNHIHFEPIVQLPDKVEVKTGEEEEDAIFEARGKMYRFVNGEWKEKGVGQVKILKHKVSNKARVLMRRDQVLKLCCNHRIEPSLNLQLMPKTDGKAWVWYALDFSEDEGKMEKLALRFGKQETAQNFKEKFDECKAQASPSPGQTPVKDAKKEVSVSKSTDSASASPRKDEDDDGVIFVKEELPSAEQVAKARKYFLPDHFYLYENKPPCKGCLGCTDGEGLPEAAGKKAPATEKAPPVQKSFFGSASPAQKSLFGSATKTLSFADVVKKDADKPSSPPGKTEEPVSSQYGNFTFGSGPSVDFSSLAANANPNGFAFKKTDSSAPFKWQGAGQKLFTVGGPADKDDGGVDEDGVAPSADVHFEPVIPLPALVEVKTGDENWTPVFCHRAKVYKYDTPLGQWKERGIGDIKIMKHNTKGLYRVLQRREQVLKVSCNHCITPEMELKPLATSETAWCWLASDLSEGEPTVEQFAVKFKNKEMAHKFKDAFEDCQERLRQAEPEPAQAEANAEETPAQPEPTHEEQKAETQEEEEEEGSHYAEGDEDDDDDDDDDDDEDDDELIFEKRVTMSCSEKGVWKKLGQGMLQINYNDDISGNSVTFTNDDDMALCKHVICMEHSVQAGAAKNSREWHPIDFSTDEAVRRHFMATFSSKVAAQEFSQIFEQGIRLAYESEISEKLPTEIDIPEVFSAGEPSS